MTILKNKSINDLEGVAGPAELNAMSYARGQVTLVGGSASQTVPGFPSTAQVYCSPSLAGGTPGIVAATYNSSTGAITFTSSSNMDTSTINYLLID
jgi:hypothetical protein